MSNIAVLGNFFGDEGKGAVCHNFSRNYDWIIRTSGGSNSGHTIYRDGVKYVHNLMPSFDWRSPRPKAFLSSGMVIDLEQLHLEVAKLFAINNSIPARVYVDPDAFLVLPEHKEEDKKNNGHIGSTNRGIGPAYASKTLRKGLRIRDIMNSATASLNSHFINKMKKMGVQFKGILELREDFKSNELLFEGAQGIMLDINHGTYPYVSCGDATVAGIYACGFNFMKLDAVYGVLKAYSTKVGEGPFPTELFEQEAESLRKLGNEYGATTGRPRRVGWIDLPALNYACKKGGITELIITKFDILNGLDKVPMCVSYEKEPMCSDDFFHAIPKYEEVKGWKDASDLNQLTPFINKVEEKTGLHVSHVSFGTDTKDLVHW